MHRIGLSFHAALATEEVRLRYIAPLRTALETSGAGIYSNYLRQESDTAEVPTEHLLIFEVPEFKVGLRQLRHAAERLALPADAQLHNLDPSEPAF